MLAVVILAAGDGTRMQSSLPKVLHQVCGKPMIRMVVDAARQTKPDKIIAVLGREQETIDELCKDHAYTVIQEKQLGTAHAVMQVSPVLKKFNGQVIVLYGDSPLITSKTLKYLSRTQKKDRSAAVVATTCLDDPKGYGRILRDESGNVVGIAEEKDASTSEKKINEINTGIYCFDAKRLFANLKKVSRKNKQKEYYLTDVIGLLVEGGEKVTTHLIDPIEAIGVNSQADLSFVNKLYRSRQSSAMLAGGVRLFDPDTSYIEADVKISADTVIYPNTIIKGSTVIKSGAEIGPNSYIEDSKIEENTKVVASVVNNATIKKGADVGPFSHIRPGTVVGENAKVGAFSEVKNTNIGRGSKVPHLSYVGDTEIGENVNVGAGTITCNYDGKKKHKTIIEDGAFIGSDTMLVAPIKIGKNSVTGAGSVLTEDVPADCMSLERNKQINVKKWSKKKRGK